MIKFTKTQFHNLGIPVKNQKETAMLNQKLSILSDRNKIHPKMNSEEWKRLIRFLRNHLNIQRDKGERKKAVEDIIAQTNGFNRINKKIGQLTTLVLVTLAFASVPFLVWVYPAIESFMLDMLEGVCIINCATGE